MVVELANAALTQRSYSVIPTLKQAREELLRFAETAREARIDKRQKELTAAQHEFLLALQRMRGLYRRFEQDFTPELLRDIEVAKICAGVEKPARRPHCFRCYTDLHSHRHKKCPECHWLICPVCGACGCEYE